VENLRVGIVRALVCGFSSVLAMFREPGERSRPGRVRVNNLEAGGVPVPAAAEPVRDIALAAATCLGGDLLGGDLVRRTASGRFSRSTPPPGSTASHGSPTWTACYRLAAEAVLSRLRGPRAIGAAVIPRE
jgi:hypothetical protein